MQGKTVCVVIRVRGLKGGHSGLEIDKVRAEYRSLLEKIKDLLDILEGIGRSCSRLVTMLKAENALGTGDEVGEAVREAVRLALGEKALLQSLRASEPGGEASGAQVLDPGRQPAGNSLEQALDGANSAAATPAKTGARPTRHPAAGQKPKRRTHETAE